MKKVLIITLVFLVVLSLCACSSDSKQDNKPEAETTVPESETASPEPEAISTEYDEYDTVIEEIHASVGAYDIWKEYKNNKEAMVYILGKISASDVKKLMIEYSSLYGYSISHTSEMGEVLKIMSSSGFEMFPKDVVLQALQTYLPTAPGYDKDSLSALYDMDDDTFYSAVKQLYSGATEAKDAESLLLTEAYKRAESKLKKTLKNPSSYKMTSLNGSKVDYNPNTGKYSVTIVITYTATNSYGGTIQDTYTYSESGTYIDGRISFSN